ncbi:MAG: lycopene cyclase family protein [Kineosporiaceae bacterium]
MTQADLEVDVAVLGGGPAGLGVVLALDALRAGGATVPTVALVDPVRRAGRDRTWCFWDAPDGAVSRLVDGAVRRRWRHAVVASPGGRVLDLDLDPLRYCLVASDDYYALADAAAARLGVRHVRAAAASVTPRPRGAVVALDGDGVPAAVRARWVLDARPAAPARPARTRWLQHFAGWSAQGVPDGDRCVLMDFRAPQPPRGLGFGYVLPAAMPGGAALVEYTVFGPHTHAEGTDYAAATRAYLDLPPLLGAPHPAGGELGPPEEVGAIPMTDARPARGSGPVLRLGATAGATRGSTGYAFAAMQRQAVAVAADLAAGRAPRVPAAYPRRHRWMDAVLLRALDREYLSGPDLFVRLFEAHPAHRVLRFLDGLTTPAEELAIMWSAPTLPMVRATLGDTRDRLAEIVRVRPIG